MTPIVGARLDVNQPKAEANARSSVEVTDSCNCCKFCFPCFGKKVKKDPRSEHSKKLSELSARTLRPDIHPAYNDQIIMDHSSNSLKRSPKIENLGDVTMHLESRDNILTIDVAKRHQAGDFSD